MNFEIGDIVISRIMQQDIGLLVEYRLKYLAELQGEQVIQNIDATRKVLENYFINAIKQNRFFAFVAEIGGVVVGFGGMVVKEIPGDFSQAVYLEGDILNMYTVPFARRKGISQMILNVLLSEAIHRGISKVALHTSKDGEHLYRKNGFAEPVYPYLELVIGPEDFKH